MVGSRDVNVAMDLCLRVGELLLANGAGAADVSATMQSMAVHLGLRNADVDVTFTSLSIGYQATPEDPPLVLMRQVSSREIDYEDLSRVNQLVLDLISGEVDVSGARRTVARIRASGHNTPRWVVTLAWGLMCAGSTLMLGGEPLVMAVAFVAAVFIDRVRLRIAQRQMPAFYQQVAGGLIAGGLAVSAAAVFPELERDNELSLVISANIIMLLSGIGFLGALQDALSGFFVTAGARIIEALLSTAGIIAGVSGGLALATVLEVDVGQVYPGYSLSPSEFATVAGGAALAAASFAVATYAPKRAVLPIAAMAGLSMVAANTVSATNLGRPWAVGVAALLVGLISYWVSSRVGVPPLVLVVPAIVPMLPGLAVYRGLALLSSGGDIATSRGLLSLVTAVSIAIALASGVILGEYVAQPLRREARRLEARLSGPRLVGPLLAVVGPRTPEPVHTESLPRVGQSGPRGTQAVPIRQVQREHARKQQRRTDPEPDPRPDPGPDARPTPEGGPAAPDAGAARPTRPSRPTGPGAGDAGASPDPGADTPAPPRRYDPLDGFHSGGGASDRGRWADPSGPIDRPDLPPALFWNR